MQNPWPGPSPEPIDFPSAQLDAAADDCKLVLHALSECGGALASAIAAVETGVFEGATADAFRQRHERAAAAVDRHRDDIEELMVELRHAHDIGLGAEADRQAEIAEWRQAYARWQDQED